MPAETYSIMVQCTVGAQCLSNTSCCRNIYLRFSEDMVDLCPHLNHPAISSCSSLSIQHRPPLLNLTALTCGDVSPPSEVYRVTTDLHLLPQTIAACTASMDPTSWNAYQIVTNRALAVCYATRQQQFRLKTEYSVNKLVHSTSEQLQAMEQLQVWWGLLWRSNLAVRGTQLLAQILS